MTLKTSLAVGLAITLTAAGPGRADVWDLGGGGDDDNYTTNEITHGFSQIHDLDFVFFAPDQDWYRIVQQPFSSYEVLCDGFNTNLTGGPFVPAPPTLERVLLGSPTPIQLQSSVPYAVGGVFNRSLRWANNTPGIIDEEFVRVANPNCGTECGPGDQYRVRAWDTTVAVPRYNNSNGQITVLMIQNTSEAAVNGFARLWPPAGGSTPVTAISFSLSARQSLVFNLASVNGGAANGTGGSITITSDGRYGQLAVKAVAVEPATGFTFDTPGSYKPAS
jgi:hypothetical protein